MELGVLAYVSLAAAGKSMRIRYDMPDGSKLKNWS